MHGDRFYCIENNLIFHLYWMIIILMFICICNAITERQVQAAVAEGATTLSDLQGQLGVAACCGCCAETATEYLRSEEHTSELQSLMRISYAVFCLQKKNIMITYTTQYM